MKSFTRILGLLIGLNLLGAGPAAALPLAGVSTAVLDFVATGATMFGFHTFNRRGLCRFGKANGANLALATTAIVGRYMSEKESDDWNLMCAFSMGLLGLLNPVRGYFGIHYHFLGGMPLPGMPEVHNDMVVELESGGFAPENSVLNWGNHALVYREVTQGSAWRNPGIFLFEFVVQPLTYLVGVIQMWQGYNLFRGA